MSFHQTATHFELEDGHILVAQLEKSDGEIVESKLDLNAYIGNDDGNFQWGGGGFADSAADISLELEGEEDAKNPILRATLNPVEGDGIGRDLNLAERIGNDNGELIFLADE